MLSERLYSPASFEDRGGWSLDHLLLLQWEEGSVASALWSMHLEVMPVTPIYRLTQSHGHTGPGRQGEVETRE